MTHPIPAPWHFGILVLAAYRACRLVGWDTITAGWRESYGGVSDADYEAWHPWITQEIKAGRDPWAPPAGTMVRVGDVMVEGAPTFSLARWRWAEMIRCPWCLGWWVCLAGWIAWLAVGAWLVWLAVWPAASAVVGLVAKWDDH
jgi:hypothetical protein